nr:hypothetical protein [Thiocapsa rosea]
MDCYDPWIDRAEAKHDYGLDRLPEAPAPGSYDAVILAVAHRDFIAMGATGIRRWAKPKSILYDVKSVLSSIRSTGASKVSSENRHPDCYDPWIDRAEAKHEYGLECLPEAPAPGSYDAVIFAVAHRDLIEMGVIGIR